MTTEYMSRMEVLAEEINSGMPTTTKIGITLNPPTVEWGTVDMTGYDGVFFAESLSGGDWDGASLAEYLETLTREYLDSEADEYIDSHDAPDMD